jgi:multidrug efflux system membrane fusion protein
VLRDLLQKNPLSVEVTAPSTGKPLASGRIAFIDNAVDQTTGTIKVKARFPNERLQLWPGQFVNVRVFVDVLKNVVVAPTAAIQRGPNGAYVFAVDEDETVRQVAVTVGQQTETTAVITAGVEPPVKLVTTGFARLTDKAKVRVSTPEEAAQPPATAPGRRGTREPGQGQGRRRDQQGGGDASGAGSAAPAPEAPAGTDGTRQNRQRRNGAAPSEGAPPGGQGSPAGGSGAQRPQAQP